MTDARPHPLPDPSPRPPRLTAYALPSHRYVPGLHAHPRHRDPALGPHLPTVPADDAVRWGLDLLAQGYLWEAHEVWEGAWHLRGPGPEREVLQGAIQVAATALLLHLGRLRAAQIQGERAARRLAPLAGVVGGLGVEGLREGLRAVLAGEQTPWHRVWRGGVR